MAQFARPISDDAQIGSWLEEGDLAVNLYESVDEVTANDTDYVKSEDLTGAGNTSVLVLNLGSVTDPGSSTGHVLRVRARKQGTAQMDMTVELREAYVNEAGQGTLIATLTQSNLSTAFADFNITLTGPEADSITDYSDLQLRMFGTYV